jgi:hypothetical protein
MQVVIIGPNLLDQSQGSFHVHAYGCADTTRNAEYRHHRDDINRPEDVASVKDIVELTYVDQLAEDPESTWQDLVTDFKIFPCVVGLSEESP